MTMQAPPPQTHEIISAIRDMIGVVNAKADDCNKRWGFNRLPNLVPIEWMERFRSQKRKWETACFECAGSPKPEDLETVRKHGEAMIRAYDKLGELAIESGYFPGPPAQWEFELSDGTPVILVRDRHEMCQAETHGRKVQIWSLEEIVTIAEKFPVLLATKDTFPGAEVVRMKTDPIVIDALDDCIDDLVFR